MKICHIMFANFYIEGWAYQENILPEYHKKIGYDVDIITTRYTKDRNGKPILRKSGSYINTSGIKVDVLDFHTWNIFYKFKKVKIVTGLDKKLKESKPDILFIHGCQFFNTMDVIKYKKEYPSVKIYIDQHGDYYNMPITGFKNYILQKVVFKFIAKRLSKYVEKFWGVTPWRVDYLLNVYDLPKQKVDLLVMGGDSDLIDSVKEKNTRSESRSLYNLDEKDFVLITGGKIDKVKNIDKLIRGFNSLGRDNLKFVIFGSISTECEVDMSNLINSNPNISFVGWKDRQEVINLFLLADLAIFPGTHSVLWEQAVACGLPVIVKLWEGMKHIDVGGNCRFLKNSSEDELSKLLKEIIDNPELYSKMKAIAMDKGVNEFSYYTIAKRSIEIDS